MTKVTVQTFLLVGLAIVAEGCMSAPQETEIASGAITGGQIETGYPAVGCLKTSYGGSGCNCTGTLIAPSVVLAAKHCGPMGAFQLGSSDSNYTEKVVVDNTIPYDPGEGTGPSSSIFAHDVELCHLQTPIYDVRPLQIDTYAVPSEGTNCIAVGFGDNSAGGEGTKYSATVHVSWTGALTTLGVTDMASAIMIVQGPDNASPPGGMPQHGDSGGPLLCNGIITGVLSGTWSYPVMSGTYYTAIDSSITFDSAWVTGVASNYVNEPLVSAVAWSANRMDIFGRGTDGAVYQKTWDTTLPLGSDNTHWYPSEFGWQYLGGFTTGTPEAVTWGPNRLDIFMRGGDSNPQTDTFSSMSLWHLFWNGSSWNWDGPLSNGLASHPVAVSWGPNRLDVFALNSLGLIGHWYGTNTITAFETVPSDNGPAKFLTGMKAFSTSSGNLDLYAVGTDNVLYHANYNSYGEWTDWDNLGGYIVGAPAVTSWGGGRQDIFVKSGDNNVYQKTYMGGAWYPSLSGWTSLGGPIGDGSPAAASMQTNWLTLMANGAYKGWFNGSQWAPTNTTWYDFGCCVAGPVLLANPGVGVNAFALGNSYTPGLSAYTPNGPPAGYGWTGFGPMGGVFSW